MHTATHHADCPSCQTRARRSKLHDRLLNVALVILIALNAAIFLAQAVATACLSDRAACAGIAGVKQ